MTVEPKPDPATDSPIGFEAVVCGVDSSPQSLEAIRQAVAMADEGARLWAVSVWDPGLAMHAGIHASTVAAELREEAASSLREARRELPAVDPVLIRGGDVAGLLAAATNLQADLLCVGSHGTSRPAGVMFGSVATAMVHYAPCCVLVARPADQEPTQPVILHAGDGSADSLDAARVAGRIAGRLGASVVTLNVGEGLDRDAAIAAEAAALIEAGGPEPVVRLEAGSPHRRIVEVAGELDASLVVVGSRGRTGLKALGSVSERVAHRASCSVLVVRRPTHPTADEG